MIGPMFSLQIPHQEAFLAAIGSSRSDDVTQFVRAFVRSKKIDYFKTLIKSLYIEAMFKYKLSYEITFDR